MAKTKYTYQDWVDGKLDSENILSLFSEGRISKSTFNIIAREQNEAYVKRMSLIFEALKQDFIDEYDTSLLRDELLDYQIQTIQDQLYEIQVYDLELPSTAFIEHTDGRYELTKEQVDRYHSLSDDELEEVYDTIYQNLDEHKTPFIYILKVNFHKWLLWFKRQRELDTKEPSISVTMKSYDRRFSLANTMQQTTKKTSYQWQNNPKKELPELFKYLIDNSLIAANTTLKQFQAVFTARPLDDIQPIKWHDDNASELLYFILQLQGTDGSLIDKEKQTDYKRLTACFVKPNGQPFTENLRQAKQNLKQYGLAPAKKEVVDSIINQFY